jgi:hypothetical protein
VLSYKDDTEYSYTYPTRRQVYEFISKYFSVEEIKLVILDELVKKGSYMGFKLQYKTEA